jgi:ribose transport system permease protein
MVEGMEEPMTTRERARVLVKRVFGHEVGVLIAVLIALIGGMSVVTNGMTSSAANMSNIVLQSSIRGVATMGQAFVLLSGGIDISIGGIALFCTLLGSVMMTETQYLNIVGYPVPIFLVLPVMLMTGAGFGAINGLLVSRIGMPALIVTLGMWEISKGFAFHISGGQSIFSLPSGHIRGRN